MATIGRSYRSEERYRADRLRTIIGCFLAQNLAMGAAYGSFGPLLEANQQVMGINRAVAASGMSVIMLVLAVLAAVAGRFMPRFKVRDVMIAGAALSAIAYFELAFVRSFQLAVIAYALIGIGIALTAILGPLALVTRWVEEGRGKILSIVNLPLMLCACPFLIGWLLPHIGRPALLMGLGMAFVVLIPLLLLLLREWPQGQEPHPGEQIVRAGGVDQGPEASVLRSPGFWLLSFGIGIMAGCGIVYVVHIVAFGLDKGMAIGAAAWLLTIYAGAGLLGTPLFGWLSDRLGPGNALVLSAGCQAVLWSLLLVFNGAPLYLVAAGLGICCTPLVTLHGAAISALFGQQLVSRAMGYSYLVKLPFIFGFGPAAGALFDTTGEYRIPFLLCSGLLIVSTVCFIGLAMTMSRRDGRHMPVATA